MKQNLDVEIFILMKFVKYCATILILWLSLAMAETSRSLRAKKPTNYKVLSQQGKAGVADYLRELEFLDRMSEGLGSGATGETSASKTKTAEENQNKTEVEHKPTDAGGDKLSEESKDSASEHPTEDEDVEEVTEVTGEGKNIKEKKSSKETKSQDGKGVKKVKTRKKKVSVKRTPKSQVKVVCNIPKTNPHSRSWRKRTPVRDTSSSESEQEEVVSTDSASSTTTSDGAARARVHRKKKKSGNIRYEIDIDDLRRNKGLVREAERQLTKLGLGEGARGKVRKRHVKHESLTRHISLEDLASQCSHCGEGKSAKSGITTKATDRVVNPQIWAHSALQYDWGCNIEFDQLNLTKLVAGELEIATGATISRREKRGRLRLLKKLLHYADGFDMSVVKAIYSAVLRRIELGLLDWESDFSETEQMALAQELSKQRKVKANKSQESQGASTAGTWFCHNFNRDKCTYRQDHTGMVRGKNRYMKHICAACYLRDRTEVRHPECSQACPLKE